MLKTHTLINIEVDNVLPNPHNGRPAHHFRTEDLQLQELVESIKTRGQINPCVVYELVGHYEAEDQPGKYVLLQGQRRYTAASLSGLGYIKAEVFPTPLSLADELELISVDDTGKRDWGKFYRMRHAKDIALAHNAPLFDTHKQEVLPIALSSVDLNASELETAHYVFLLEPTLVNMVELYQNYYEEKLRERGLEGKAPKGIVKNHPELLSLSPNKAALTWKIYSELLPRAKDLATKHTPEQLQLRIAKVVCYHQQAMSRMQLALETLENWDNVSTGDRVTFLSNVKTVLSAPESFKDYFDKAKLDKKTETFKTSLGLVAEISSRTNKLLGMLEELKLNDHDQLTQLVDQSQFSLERLSSFVDVMTDRRNDIDPPVVTSIKKVVI